MKTIKIEQSGGKLSATTPFHPDFGARAKKLGGRWDAARRAWTFDARDEARVRELCVTLFGTDGSPVDPADLLTIRADAKVCDAQDTSYWLAGREVARIRGRDSGATLGDGVVVLTGGFFSGGSVKNPRIGRKERTTFELRDVSRAMAERVHGEFHGVALLDAAGAVVREATVAEPEFVPGHVLANTGGLLGHLRAADEAGVAPFEAKLSTLPMAINVEAVVRFIVAGRSVVSLRPAHLARVEVLDYFAPEDRPAVAPVVDAVLAEKIGGAS